MLITDKIPESGDPSSHHQNFNPLKFNILCCRYWWFEIWKGQRMSFPFWRLYWNKNEGAYVYYEKKVDLLPDHIYLIPPHTPYSTGIVDQKLIMGSEYFFKCGRVNSKGEEDYCLEKGKILHFFVHFTLGNHYDSVRPGIYGLKISEEKAQNIAKILETLISGREFSMRRSLDVYSLVLSSVNKIAPQISLVKNVNIGIANVIDFMEKNIGSKMTNETLASKLYMSSSAFARLFKKHTGKRPSEYLREIRVEKAGNLLLYTNMSIDVIADRCGFSDRYHLTKVFTQQKNTSPAAFRKSVGYF